MSTTLQQNQQKQAPAAQSRNWRRPVYDVVEQDDSFVVYVQVPGVKREGIDISVEDQELHVTASRSDSLPADWKALRRETRPSDYYLRLRLNVEVDADSISAKAEDGILALNLPKSEVAKPRKIAIE